MPRHKRRNTFHLGSKNSDLMKLDQFMSYYKRKKIIKKFHKNCGLKPISRPFCVCKELITTSIEKQNFWTSWKLSKFVLRIPFPEDSLKIKQGLEIVSRPHFSYNFLIKKLFCNITLTGQILSPDCVYFPRYSIKCFVFHA